MLGNETGLHPPPHPVDRHRDLDVVEGYTDGGVRSGERAAAAGFGRL